MESMHRVAGRGGVIKVHFCSTDPSCDGIVRSSCRCLLRLFAEVHAQALNNATNNDYILAGVDMHTPVAALRQYYRL